MSTVFLKIISVGSFCSSPCVAIVTENSRFIVNLPEGTQRLCIESKIRLGKVRGLLLPCQNTSSSGGLPGLCLTLADVGSANVIISGPSLISAYLESTRSIMRVSGQIFTISDLPKLRFDDLSVEQISFPSEANNLMRKCCFLIQTNELKGKFDVQKAENLKIPKGPLFGKLKNGFAVTLVDGTVIQPEEVVGTSEKSRYCLFICSIEMNELRFLEQLSPELQRFKSDESLHDRLDYMLHFSDTEVVESAEYSAWMGSFPSSVRHVILGKESRSNLISPMPTLTAFYTSVKYCSMLRIVCPDLFPQLFEGQEKKTDLADSVGVARTPNLIRAFPNMKLTVLPMNKRETSEYSYPVIQQLQEEIDKFQSELNNNSDFLQKLSHAKKMKDELSGGILSTKERNEVILAHSTNTLYFLGTGCAIPCKYRNVSGILLHLPSSSSMVLLDVGEGSWEQMLRLVASTPELQKGNILATGRDDCSIERFEAILAMQLKVIWISHPHADHLLGSVRVISERWRILLSLRNGVAEGKPDPVVVIAPPNVLKFLLEFSIGVEESFAAMYVPVSCRQFDPQDDCSTSDIYWTAVNQQIIGTNAKYCMETSLSGESEQSTGQKINNSVGRQKSRYALIPERVRLQAEEQLATAMKIFRDVGIRKLTNVPVIHCSQSYGLLVEANSFFETSSDAEVDTFKLVYSGDTRPCDALIEMGADATILIHEATFEDSLQSEAIKKRHSTVIEALTVAKNMNAFRVILTHFSQRYPGLPPLSSLEKDENGVEMLEKTIFAFDFMSLSFPSLLWAPMFVPALVAAFPPKEADSVEEEEEEREGEDGGAFHGVSATDCACEIVIAASTEKRIRKATAMPTSKKLKLSNSIEKNES